MYIYRSEKGGDLLVGLTRTGHVIDCPYPPTCLDAMKFQPLILRVISACVGVQFRKKGMNDGGMSLEHGAFLCVPIGGGGSSVEKNAENVATLNDKVLRSAV
jgi:hypothetical protein